MSDQISASVCERLIVASTSHCSAAVPDIPKVALSSQQAPKWDSISASLTALSTAFTWGTIVIALVAIILAGGWGYLVRVWAKEEARKIAKEEIDGWLRNEAPKIFREANTLLKLDDETLNAQAAQQKADALGNAAG